MEYISNYLLPSKKATPRPRISLSKLLTTQRRIVSAKTEREQVDFQRALQLDAKFRKAVEANMVIGPLPETCGLVDPDPQLDEKEPWAKDSLLITPIQTSQMLIYESALVLAAKTYLTLLNLPFQTKEVCNSSDLSPTGRLPVLRCGSVLISGLDGIIRLAQAKSKSSLTAHLQPAERADAQAYLSMVQNILGNALLYFTWMDSTVYTSYSKPRVASVFNFPLSALRPWCQWREVVTYLDVHDWTQRTPEEVYKAVETCLLALSERLGESKYFIGPSPTELDAVVFGYLFSILHTPLPNNNLVDMVMDHPNLVKFCDDMRKPFSEN